MTTNKHILLINRDKQYGEQLAQTLQDGGFAVHAAVEMRSALSILAAHAVGLIVCDNDLEDISGNEFLSFLKKDPLRENIPVMFLVSLENQGRPSKSFELGAVDYLVYPVEMQSVVERIQENFKLPEGVQEEEAVKEEAAKPVQTPEPADAQAAAQVPMPPVPMEVSRDGVIWMPSKLVDFSTQNIQIQTSLFGKKGVSLILRFKRPQGKFVVYGRINEITMDDFQKPADIDVAVEESDTWRDIHAWLIQTRNAAATGAVSDDKKVEPEEVAQTIALSQSVGSSSEISAEELFKRAESKKPSYDIRFYNSIIGKQLDNYRVIALIAAGSMGGVLQGWDVALEREVALKIISFELSSKEQFRDMFVKEARVVSRLNHINIAQIYNIGCSNDILYYAMEYIDGATLKDLIKKEGRLSLLKGMAIMNIACKGLEFVYQHGIVHRDIKPANIMINKAGEVKIVDFGVAHNKGAKTSDKTKLMGTPLYMSPEQIVGLTLDHRSDMYSLGATFYHAFSGAPPFAAKAVNDILDQHLNATLPRLSEKNRKIPKDLSKILHKMMAKDPNHRYQSFKQISEEMQALRMRLISSDRRSQNGNQRQIKL